MTAQVTLSGKDFTKEPTSVTLYFEDTTAANYDDQVAAIATVRAAINAVILDNLGGTRFSPIAAPVDKNYRATDPSAQREQKWRVSYTDDVEVLGGGSFELPMNDNTQQDPNGSGELETGANRTALISAIETHCVSRLGNPITVTSIKHVGRNN